AARRGNHGRNSADQEGVAGYADDSRNFECLIWIAAGRARSGEFGLSVLLHKSRVGFGDCEYGKAGALCFDSGTRTRVGGEFAVSGSLETRPCRTSECRVAAEYTDGLARTEQGTTGRVESVSHRCDRRALSHGHKERKGARRGFAARSKTGELHH